MDRRDPLAPWSLGSRVRSNVIPALIGYRTSGNIGSCRRDECPKPRPLTVPRARLCRIAWRPRPRQRRQRWSGLAPNSPRTTRPSRSAGRRSRRSVTRGNNAPRNVGRPKWQRRRDLPRRQRRRQLKRRRGRLRNGGRRPRLPDRPVHWRPHRRWRVTPDMLLERRGDRLSDAGAPRPPSSRLNAVTTVTGTRNAGTQTPKPAEPDQSAWCRLRRKMSSGNA